jgi:phosphohistidine phosphatase
MELYFLRHAIAEDRTAPQLKSDKDRALTSKGEKKMRRIAKGMKKLGLSFDLILSSPYLRAKQTAEIVAEEFKSQKALEFSSNLAPGGNPKALIEELNEKHGKRKRICLVGHEPYLSSMISVLVAGDAKVAITLKKAGLCKLSLDQLNYGRCATLEWLLAPKLLKCIC